MRVCKDNKCQIKCAKDTDCDPFYTCDTAAAACIYKGCSNQLDCIASTGNPLAQCNANKKCDVPCQSDPECVATRTANGVNGQPVTALIAGLQICAVERVSRRAQNVGSWFAGGTPNAMFNASSGGGGLAASKKSR